MVEFARNGFALAGGRPDPVNGGSVAAIVRTGGCRMVNLFVWAAKDTAQRSFVKDGFAVTEWSRSGLRFAEVSDIPPAEVREFRRLFDVRSS